MMADEDTPQTPVEQVRAAHDAKAEAKTTGDPVFGDNAAAKTADDERRKDNRVDWSKYPNKVR